MTVPTPMVFLLALLVLALGGWVAFLRGKLARGAAQSTADQREAAAAREQLALALEASSLALWDFDVVSGQVYLSETWSTMLGGESRPTTTTIAALSALVPEEDRETASGALGAALKGPGSHYRFEHRVATPAGVTIWIVSEGRVVARGADGRALRMLGTNRDISGRVKRAEALRESEARFKGAFENSATGIALIGLNERWLKVNRALCEITGYEEAELLSLSYQDLTHPEDRQVGPASLDDLLSGTREAIQIDKRYIHKRGHEVWVLVNLTLVRDKLGKPEHFISQTLDMSERRRLQERVEHLALHDPLTGLPNSRLLLDRLEQTIAAARRAKRAMGVLYIDLDGFKPVNDTWGHATGDRVLKTVAGRLTQALRETDSVARVGGDEFVAILGPVATESDAISVAGRVLTTVAMPMDLGNAWVELSASIGIALYPNHGEDAQSLLQRADTAMYQAKRSGKNVWRFFSLDPG